MYTSELMVVNHTYYIIHGFSICHRMYQSEGESVILYLKVYASGKWWQQQSAHKSMLAMVVAVVECTRRYISGRQQRVHESMFVLAGWMWSVHKGTLAGHGLSSGLHMKVC